MRKLRKILGLAGVVIAIITIIMMANTRPAQAGGESETPTPPVAGSGSYTTTQSVDVQLLPDAEYFAKVDCLIYNNIVVGYQSQVALLKKGNGITITGWSADGLWASVSDGTISGWTLAANLSDHPPVTARTPQYACAGSCGSTAVAPTISTGGSTATMCVNTAGLNRRNGPGTWYPKAGDGMGRGAPVSLTGTKADNGWVQAVTPGGITAWVAGWLLGACGESATPAASVGSAPSGTCPYASPDGWGPEDDGGAFQLGDHPQGSPDFDTYGQYWDGRDVKSTVHVAIARGLILRILPINGNTQGTKWHLCAGMLAAHGGPPYDASFDGQRFEEMQWEVEMRDDFRPPLYIIDEISDPTPYGWEVVAHPSAP